MAIKKMNAKDKDRDKDAFLSSLRMPFEGLFSKVSQRARYRGQLKVYFQALMEALVSNFKRLITIGAEPIPIQ
jgi:transposase, IS5 family